ncbi:MAG TPA: ABC transporter permease subunit [Geminicoccus sp.]|uniref:ABC transporter permease subunit n=1 Tax=Geminicoccus sp. TaxID=2024832 RepID=UPI002E341C68|nr:ABC transporter permease subunit [Geminicoccus sp.]HEX2529275.1 ABC transporter permease subunit [Geminicoccus sp.]
MVRRTGTLIGNVTALLVGLTLFLPILALLATGLQEAGQGGRWLDGRTLLTLRFTLVQATLSALLAVLPAVLVARALVRRSFPGRDLLERLLALPVLVPALVAGSALLVLFGRRGWVAELFGMLGIPWPSIYGLTGILIGHVFLNLPLAVRILAPAWRAVPAEQWRLARQLGLGDLARFRLIEWPALAPRIARALGIVFMLCFTSFALPMTLGGGPAGTTMEVAIYEALRVDADLVRVAVLALLQIALCSVLVGIGLGVRTIRSGVSTGAPPKLRVEDGLLAKALDGLVLAAALLFLGAPLLALLLEAAGGPWWKVLSAPMFLVALRNSVVVALAAALISLVAGSLLVLGARGRAGFLMRAGEYVGSIPLVTPALALGAGLFLLLRRVVDPAEVALPAIALANGLMGLPYVVAILGPEVARREMEHGRLCRALGIGGATRWRLIDLPTLLPVAGLAGGLVAAFSLGDFGVVALFGADEARTLPMHLHLQAGSYRSADAAVTAVVLVVLAAGLMWAVERGLAHAVRR